MALIQFFAFFAFAPNKIIRARRDGIRGAIGVECAPCCVCGPVLAGKWSLGREGSYCLELTRVTRLNPTRKP